MSMTVTGGDHRHLCVCHCGECIRPLRARRAHSPVAAGQQCIMHSCIDTLWWAGKCPLKTALPVGDLVPHVIHGYLGWHESAPRRHLDRFGHFCTAHPCTQHTHIHTDHATCDICSNRPHLCTACRRCGLKIHKTVCPSGTISKRLQVIRNVSQCCRRVNTH